MATNEQILQKLNELSATIGRHVERLEERVDDHERRLTVLETTLSALPERFHRLEQLITGQNAALDRMWKIILILLALLALLVGGAEALKLIVGVL